MTQCHLPPSHVCVLFFCYILSLSQPVGKLNTYLSVLNKRFQLPQKDVPVRMSPMITGAGMRGAGGGQGDATGRALECASQGPRPTSRSHQQPFLAS